VQRRQSEQQLLWPRLVTGQLLSHLVGNRWSDLGSAGGAQPLVRQRATVRHIRQPGRGFLDPRSKPEPYLHQNHDGGLKVQLQLQGTANFVGENERRYVYLRLQWEQSINDIYRLR